MRQGPVHGVASHYHTVSLIWGPGLKEFPGCTALQHARSSQDNAGPMIGILVEKLVPLRHVLNVLKCPRIAAAIGLLLHTLTAHACVRFEYPEALSCHGRVVVDWDVVEVRIPRPIVLKNEKQLLRSTKGENRQKAFSTCSYNLMHRVCEAPFTLLTRFVCLHTVSALHYEHMNLHLGDFGHWQMPVLFATVVAGVKHPDAPNVDHKHGRTQDVSGTEARELDPTKLSLLVKTDKLNPVHDLVYVTCLENLVLCSNLAHAGIIMPQKSADRSCWMSHEDLALELCAVHEVWDRARMIKVEMCDQKQVDFGRIYMVKIGQRAHA
mmetsp:Transcript_109600/g.217639  ORF Transcript_109600/g.217639 Transcript_109600/m.217639 type:complete len:323 (+) Transcript_109600:672-1640(+)